MTTVLDWTHTLSEIGEIGLDVRREASAVEIAAVTAELGIVACHSLVVTYRLEPLPQSRVRARGKIRADVEQSCVVTLDPVPQRIDEPFEIEFWPKGQIESPPPGEREALAPDEPEPIENHRIAIGRVVYEFLASALDPYPRANGAALDDGELVAAPRDSKAHPFAALAKWQPKKD